MKINHSCIEEALVISDRVLAFALNIINRSHYIFYSKPLAPENVSTWHRGVSIVRGGRLTGEFDLPMLSEAAREKKSVMRPDTHAGSY
jgi:hypothetical protein